MHMTLDIRLPPFFSRALKRSGSLGTRLVFAKVSENQLYINISLVSRSEGGVLQLPEHPPGYATAPSRNVMQCTLGTIYSLEFHAIFIRILLDVSAPLTVLLISC